MFAQQYYYILSKRPKIKTACGGFLTLSQQIKAFKENMKKLDF
jgi:hypothetical protein